MNKLWIQEDQIWLEQENLDVEVVVSDKLDIFDVKKIKIHFFHDTILEIEDHSKEESKLDFKVEVEPFVCAKLHEVRAGKKNKIQYQYFLEENSQLEVSKFYDCYQLKELHIIHLLGKEASIECQFKTIAQDQQKIDMVIYHDSKNTSSSIDNKGITVGQGSLVWNVTSMVYQGVTGCNVSQKSHIINYNHAYSEIHPNLFIEEEDVSASHAAFIGTFSEDLFFYLQARGIPYLEALFLLIHGFFYEEWMKPEELERVIRKIGR